MGGMFNSTTLDVMVGLIFVYILLAIMCSSINEWFAGLLHLRSGTLTTAVQHLLDSQDQPGGVANDPTATWMVQQFKSHPLIDGMKQPNGDLPSYIPSRTFATAVMDLVTPKVQGPLTFTELQQGLGNLPDGDVKRALLALTQDAQDDLEKAQKNIEKWFDDAMDQASGWYKRKAALVTFLIAVALTLGTDADTIQITQNLWTNPTARAKIVAEANAKVEQAKNKQNSSNGTTPPGQNATGQNGQGSTPPAQGPGTDSSASPTLSKDELNSIGDILPAWKHLPEGNCSQLFWGWLKKVLGWLLTIAAVSLGAPFWFDLLGKISNLRNAGQKPKTAQENQQQTADANA